MAQVFVVVAAGSVIGFIIRDLGDGAIAGWIIQVDQHCLLPLSIFVAHDEYPAGTVVDAERPLTHCRASIRCS
jgi:hypothetical protein